MVDFSFISEAAAQVAQKPPIPHQAVRIVTHTVTKLVGVPYMDVLYIALGCAAVAFGFGVILQKYGWTGIKNDISTVYTDVKNVIPTTPTPTPVPVPTPQPVPVPAPTTPG